MGKSRAESGAALMTLQFEDVLQQAGDFGRYQKTLICLFLLPAVTVIPWFMLGVVFLSSTPDHWCRNPEVENSSMLSLEEKMLLLRPENDPFCSAYDVNFTDVITGGNLSLIGGSWDTKPCSEGWNYDDTNYYATASTRWNLVCEYGHYSSMIVSTVFIGNAFGASIMGSLPDRIGRKPTFLFLVLLIGLTEITSVFVPDFTLFLILRIINGSCGSLMYITSYVILLELVGADMRTRMNAFTTAGWTTGLCLLPLLAWLTKSWIGLSISISVAAFCLLLTWKILPESPRWLASQGRCEEAYAILCDVSRSNGGKAHESPEVLDQLKTIGEMMEKESKEEKEKASYFDLLKYPQLRKKFLILLFLWTCNTLAYYGLQVNVKNLFGSEFFNFFLLSVVEFPGHGVAWFVMQRYGRKWCTVGAAALTSLSCLVPVFTIQVTGGSDIIGVVASVFGKLGASAAFMSLFQQAPELYPTPVRGLGMSLSASSGTAFALAGPYIADLAVYGKHIPFLIFGVLSLCASFVATFLPETLNRELPQTIAESEKFEVGKGIFSCFSFKKKTGNTERNQIIGFSNPVFAKERTIPTIEVCENMNFVNPIHAPSTDIAIEIPKPNIQTHLKPPSSQ